MTSTQSGMSALLNSWSDAIRNKDIDRLMSFYAPDVAYFDVVPPLQILGSSALRRNFVRWFEGWNGPIGQDVRDLTMSANADLAAAHMLIRASGTLKIGRDVDYWVRTTVCCRCFDRRWLITHEHVSVPVDFQSGAAAFDLTP